MTFGRMDMLWLGLAATVLLAGLLRWSWRKQLRLVRQFVPERLLAQLTTQISWSTRKWRLFIVAFSIALLFLAMSQPRWGFVWEEAEQRGRDVILAIDTSRSMLAGDIPPSRLARAKLAALELVELSGSDRFGLVAFAGGAFLQAPLTFDDEVLRQNIQLLEPGIIPQGGTALYEAVDAALGAFKKADGDNHKVLVLFTDGEDHEGGVDRVIERAREAKLKIFTVGVGTAEGQILKIPDAQGNPTLVRDDSGNVVKSRLDEKALREIATQTGGFYLPLQGAETMRTLRAQGLAPLPTTESGSAMIRQPREQFHWPLGLAILLLALEPLLPDRRRAAKPASTAGAAKSAAIAGLLALATTDGWAASQGSAFRHYEKGEYDAAAREYNTLLGKRPADAQLQFNAGSAAYQADRLEEARQHFESALRSPDLELQQKAYNNLANTLFRIGEAKGDPKAKMADWTSAVENYQNALKLKPDYANAAANRDYAQQRLEELKKQQEEQKQQQQQQGQDNKEEKQDSDGKDQDKQQQDDQKQEKGDQQSPDEKQQGQKPSEPQGDDQQKQDQQQEQGKDQGQESEAKPKEEESKEGKGEEGEGAKPKNAEKPDGAKEDSGKPGKAAEEAKAAQLGQMTPAQAKQLLEAMKSDEQTLLLPKDMTRKGKQRVVKDW